MLLLLVTHMYTRPQIGFYGLEREPIRSGFSVLQPRIQFLDGIFSSDSNLPGSLDLLISPVPFNKGKDFVLDFQAELRGKGYNNHLVFGFMGKIPEELPELDLIYYLPFSHTTTPNRFVKGSGVMVREISDLLGVSYDYCCPIGKNLIHSNPTISSEEFRDKTNPKYVPEDWTNKKSEVEFS